MLIQSRFRKHGQSRRTPIPMYVVDNTSVGLLCSVDAPTPRGVVTFTAQFDSEGRNGAYPESLTMHFTVQEARALALRLQQYATQVEKEIAEPSVQP